MNPRRKYYVFILAALLMTFDPGFCFAQAYPRDSSTKQTGFISVTATMTITVESPEKKLRDSIMWEQQDLLLKYYGGRKIKQVLFQRSTGRVVIFLRGGDHITLDKATAIKEGVLKPDPVTAPEERRPFLPLRPIDIYLDSPIYIGIKNSVTIYGPDIADIIGQHPGAMITSSGQLGEYIITADVPGTAIFTFRDSATGKEKYLCHARIRRLPSDDLLTEPDVRLGNISTLTVQPDILKRQAEIFVGNGFSFAGGTAYFAGTGFRDVFVTPMDTKLTWLKPYIDLCLPGSQIVFDNITVKDPSGKVYSVEGFTITVIDPSDLPGAATDYYTVTNLPDFPYGSGALKDYVTQQLSTSGEKPGSKKAAFAFKIEADGTVAPVSDKELSLLNNFERKCFDIIKNGPQWTPGKFKGKNTAMPVSFWIDY